MALSFQANASPNHRIMHSAHTHAKATCVYPDGSSPVNRPEIHCYQPSDFLKAYGIDQVHALGFTGKGQTIILVDSYGSPTLQADLDHFSDTFKLPHTTIQFVYPNGTYLNPMQTADQVGWAQETTLDLEWAHALAPDATLVNVVSSSDETTGMAGMADLMNGIQMAVAKYPNGIVSMSFGTGESTFSADEAATYLQGQFHQILQNATDAGLTLLASAGDSGSAELNLAQTSLFPKPDASYPATDPLITAVGGTAIESGWLWTPEGTADDYWSCQLAKQKTCPKDFLKSTTVDEGVVESVWKEDWAVAAGGGGISTVFTTPYYQTSLSYRVQEQVNGQRAIPDVAMNAAINGGVDVYTSFVAPKFQVPAPAWQSFGGTSCASPETAALVALAGQAASEQLGQRVGIGALNPLVYSLSQRAFNDIIPVVFGADEQVTIDNNALYFSSSVLASLGPIRIPPVAVAGYETTQGYDLATGLGSPNAVHFVLELARARVAQAYRLGR